MLFSKNQSLRCTLLQVAGVGDPLPSWIIDFELLVLWFSSAGHQLTHRNRFASRPQPWRPPPPPPCPISPIASMHRYLARHDSSDQLLGSSHHHRSVHFHLHNTHILFYEAGRWLNVVQALDLEAASRVQERRQQLLWHVHLQKAFVQSLLRVSSEFKFAVGQSWGDFVRWQYISWKGGPGKKVVGASKLTKYSISAPCRRSSHVYSIGIEIFFIISDGFLDLTNGLAIKFYWIVGYKWYKWYHCDKF